MVRSLVRRRPAAAIGNITDPASLPEESFQSAPDLVSEDVLIHDARLLEQSATGVDTHSSATPMYSVAHSSSNLMLADDLSSSPIWNHVESSRHLYWVGHNCRWLCSLRKPRKQVKHFMSKLCIGCHRNSQEPSDVPSKYTAAFSSKPAIDHGEKAGCDYCIGLDCWLCGKVRRNVN